jgi:hypothetical protein
LFKNDMKKSVLTFGLLASSLVMLAIMPLFNNNNNSLSNTAMAQEYDKYGDSSYSQYPTDDNKYQCRTGPFEGFFVSSVEFCKHIKFDDKDRKDIRDNRTGTQGPPGPQGIQGAIGPNGTQGPPGPNLIPSANIYSVNGSEAHSADGALAQSNATCDEGDTVVSGSYFLQFPQNVNFVDDRALGSHEGWIAVVETNDDVGLNAFITAHAECFDNPPAH